MTGLTSYRKRIFLSDIARHTSRVFSVSVTQLYGASRVKDLVRARHCLYFLSREMTDLSYPDIGRRIGGRDHTSVINGVKKCVIFMQRDPIYRAKVRRVRKLAKRQHNPLMAKPFVQPKRPSLTTVAGISLGVSRGPLAPDLPDNDDEMEMLSAAVREHFAAGRDFIEVY